MSNQNKSDVGKDTDNDGRAVKHGHKAGDVDGKNRGGQQQAQMHEGRDVGKDTDGDGRVVKPGHKAGEIDGKDQQRR